MSETIPVQAEGEERGSVTDRACRWIVSGDTGISSKAIWAVMMGVHDALPNHSRSTPSDASDFGRCYRLLKLIPEWEDSLRKMKAIDFDCTINGVRYDKMWSRFVDNYFKMKRMYLREHVTGSAPELYKFMRSIGL